MQQGPLFLRENDPARGGKEAALRALDDEALSALYWLTRAAAKEAKERRDMDALFSYVRGTKTIQRIAAERGLLIDARRRAG